MRDSVCGQDTGGGFKEAFRANNRIDQSTPGINKRISCKGQQCVVGVMCRVDGWVGGCVCVCISLCVCARACVFVCVCACVVCRGGIGTPRPLRFFFIRDPMPRIASRARQLALSLVGAPPVPQPRDVEPRKTYSPPHSG